MTRLLMAIVVGATAACEGTLTDDGGAIGQSDLDTAVAFHTVAGVEDACTSHYSPTVLRDPSGAFFHMWSGGWRNCRERDVDGNDKIFHAVSTDLAGWSFDAAPVIASGAVHFNDPTVVLMPDPGGSCAPNPVFLMYMTGCTTVDDCFSVGGNKTYGSVSCNGVTWSPPQLVIGTYNGYGGEPGGAWSPSALKVSDGFLYLYFHDHWGKVLRQAIAWPNLFTPVGPPELVSSGYHVNVSVSRTPTGGYEMLADQAHAGASGTFPIAIHRLVSRDGLHFTEDPTFAPLSGLPNNTVLTGHQLDLDATTYWVFFGWGGATAGTLSMAAGRFTRPPPPGPTSPGCGRLLPGQQLYQGQGVWSCDGRSLFVHQGDGHVVLYRDGVPLWWTGVTNPNSHVLAMQADGNLVEYDTAWRPIWHSQTWGHPGAFLVMQDDCNAVLYLGSRALWQTHTWGCVRR